MFRRILTHCSLIWSDRLMMSDVFYAIGDARSLSLTTPPLSHLHLQKECRLGSAFLWNKWVWTSLPDGHIHEFPWRVINWGIILPARQSVSSRLSYALDMIIHINSGIDDHIASTPCDLTMLWTLIDPIFGTLITLCADASNYGELQQKALEELCVSHITGWWFGTCLFFHIFGNNHPNWLIFFRGGETTNQIRFLDGLKWYRCDFEFFSMTFSIPAWCS